MALVAVSGVVNKLGDLLSREATFLYGVSDQIDLVRMQLDQMQCFLKDAASKQKKDERVKGWVRNIRDVAFETEDAIDEFLSVTAGRQFGGGDFFEECAQYIVGLCAGSPFGCGDFFKGCAQNFVELYARHLLGNKIFKIQAKLDLISKGRTTFGIENLGDERREAGTVFKGVVDFDDDSFQLVGFNDAKNNLIDQLISRESEQRRRVVSIVGQGGLGKTTLAQKVYNSKEVKRHFDVTIWLTISSDFKLVDILRKGLENLGSSVQRERGNDKEYLSGEMKRVLGDKIYLVVLDDVWKKEFFAQFASALPNAANGSRVLLTSRSVDVAKHADPTSIPYELHFLNDDESLKLLLTKAFPYQNVASNCCGDLVDVAKQLANKCGGLPLALVVVGGLLSVRAPTYDDWNRVLQTIDWQFDGIQIMQVLATSYEDLPYSLKPCFLYLACFPEDYEIETGPLTRMWIAEGFIPTEGRGTLEDEAKRYLEELAQRCLVQVSERSLEFGTIERCRVHDLLHELAINEAMEENFLQVNPKRNEGNHFASRRAACFGTDEFCTNGNLRSLLIYDSRLNWISFNLLKVLELNGVNTTKNLPSKVTSMVHLRYLGLRRSTFCSLPETIEHLQNLQTLDIRNSNVTSVPVSLWNITTLRHVLASRRKPINGPPKGARLEHLQTLGWVKVMAWEESLPCIQNIRVLLLSNKDEQESKSTAQLLKNLEHLRQLGVEWQILPEEIVDMRSFRSYEHIRSLWLDGEWPQGVPLTAAMFPVHIARLILSATRFEQDPMPELKKLPSIKDLDVRTNNTIWL